MRLNLQAKLLIPSLFLMVLGITVLTYVAVSSAKHAIHEQLYEEMEQIGHELETELEAWISHILLHVEQNSRRKDFKAVLQANVEQEALQYANEILWDMQHTFGFAEIGVMNTEGEVVASSHTKKVLHKNYRHQPYFQTALRGQSNISKVALDNALGEPVFTLAAPIKHNEHIIGVTFITLSLNKIAEQFIAPLHIGHRGYAYMLEQDGTFIAHPRKDYILNKKITDFEFGAQLMRIQKGFFEYVFEEKNIDAYIEVMPNTGWIVVIQGEEEDIFAPINRLRNQVIKVGLALALALGLALFFFGRSMAKPLLVINRQLQQLAKGNPSELQINYRGNDEIGEIVKAIRQLRVSIHDTIEQANAIAEGDYSSEVQLLSDEDKLGKALRHMVTTLRRVIAQADAIADGDYSHELQMLSEQDQLGKTLQRMTYQLQQMTEENAAANWLKSGQADLSERMSGDQSLEQLAEKIISFLPCYVDAQVGAFYLLETNEEEGTVLRMVASHAYIWRSHADICFKPGQGLVGEAARERKAFVLTNPPSAYMQIESGLGKTDAQAILVMPFMYENELKGVLEIASIHSFTPLHRKFLEQVMPMIGIAVNTAESRSRMQLLLQKSQEQALALKKQTSEVEETNVKLKSQAAELQSQAEEMQAQSEELQSQQEELRQTNEQLESRTQELEKQQKDVEEKNSELEKAKSSIQTKAEELELASKYKSEFLANMSHELRTPLNSLLILAQLLASNKENNLNEKQTEYARTIYHSGADLLNLINDILDLSKVEAGKIQVSPEPLFIGQLQELVEQKFRHVAEEKGLEFSIKCDADIPESLYTDAQRLQQIISNLLSNALKFTRQGHVSLSIHRPPQTIEFLHSNLQSNNSVAFSISDSGIGVPHNKQKAIFEAFQQADGTTSRKYGGTGLGLSISRQLAQLLGGEIQLRSEPGKGSTFTVYLPERLSSKADDNVKAHVEYGNENAALIHNTEETPLPPLTTPSLEKLNVQAQASESASSTPDDRDHLQTNDKRLLIVEDDESFAKLVMKLAQEKDFKCILASDGKTALQLAQQYQPGGIILDVGLPQIDGWTVMEHLKENANTRHIPVHFVSGHDHLQDARRMGAIGYSLKPVSLGELSDVFHQLESHLEHQMKHLLLLSQQEEKSQHIKNLLHGVNTQITQTQSLSTAMQHLLQHNFDCAVLDLAEASDEDVNTLRQACSNKTLNRTPIIVYAEQPLRDEIEEALEQCVQTLGKDWVILKEVRSPERLLDEVTLFLHQIESKLPHDQQQILRRTRDQEAIFTGKKVLLVDDDVRNVFALGETLEEKGLEVSTATNGKAALERLNKEPNINLVLMDIMMPEMDGYEAMQEIRKQSRWRKLPVIALTAKAMKGDKNKCIEAGANDYMAKPVNTDRLLSLLRVWLYR